MRGESGARAMLRDGFSVLWGSEVRRWCSAGAERSWIRGSVIGLLVFGGAVYRWGGIGQRAVEGPLGLFFFRDGSFVGECLTAVGLLWRELVRWPMAALGSVGRGFREAFLRPAPSRIAVDVEEKAEKRKDQESSDRDGDCHSNFGIPFKTTFIG